MSTRLGETRVEIVWAGVDRARAVQTVARSELKWVPILQFRATGLNLARIRPTL